MIDEELQHQINFPNNFVILEPNFLNIEKDESSSTQQHIVIFEKIDSSRSVKNVVYENISVNVNLLNEQSDELIKEDAGYNYSLNFHLHSSNHESVAQHQYSDNEFGHFNNHKHFDSVSEELPPISSLSNKTAEQEKVKLKNKSKFKRYENIKCSICGDHSSGFHYGAYTCEACKLFFKRAIRAKRKRVFNECKNKQCLISSTTRKACTECRFKKCIAVGMDLSRSKYGRHTSETQQNDRDHVPNISSSLSTLHEELSSAFKHYLKDNPRNRFNEIWKLFDNFYTKCLSLLGSDKKQNEGKLALLKNASEKLNCLILKKNFDLCDPIILATYMVLFDYSFRELMIHNSVTLLYANNLAKIKTQICEQLFGNEFSVILKVLSFIYVLNLFKNTENTLQDSYKKRLTDLIKSEFALFKKKDVESSQDLCSAAFNSSCAFDCFMISLIEIGILANQYFEITI